MLLPYINKSNNFLIDRLSCLAWFLDFVSYLFSNINPAVYFKHTWKFSVHESNEVPVVSVHLEKRCYSTFVLLSPLKCITERSPAAVSHSPSLILFLFNSVERLIPVRVLMDPALIPGTRSSWCQISQRTRLEHGVILCWVHVPQGSVSYCRLPAQPGLVCMFSSDLSHKQSVSLSSSCIHPKQIMTVFFFAFDSHVWCFIRILFVWKVFFT